MLSRNAQCRFSLLSTAILFTLAIMLSACGGGGGGNGDVTRNPGGTPTYTVGGSVFGLTGTLILQNSQGEKLTLTSNTKSNFTFTTSLSNGDHYHITVYSQPDFEQCSVVGGQGSISSSDINSISVGCFPVPDLTTHSLSKTVKLSWRDSGRVTSYTLYYAPTPCDITNFMACNYKTLNNITPTSSQAGLDTYDVTGLTNGQNYYFYLEGNIDGGYQTASAIVGARPNVLVADAAIKTMTTDATGNVYLGGDFTHIGAATGRGVVVDAHHSGSIRSELFPTISDSYVHAVVSDGNGGWYIGGEFNQIGNPPQTRNSLAHILADGSVDPNWQPNANNAVSGLAFDGTTIYVGGYFTTIDGKLRNGVAAIDATGKLLDWAPSPGRSAANSNAITVVHSIAVSGGNVYIGGEFDNVTDNSGTVYVRKNLAAITAPTTSNLTGTVLDWNPNPGYDPNNNIQYVGNVVASGNLVYVSGSFINFTDKNNTVVARKYLAAINPYSTTDPNGTLDAWDPEPNFVPDTLLAANNTLYVGGEFNQVMGKTRNHLAAFDNASTAPSLSAWDPNVNGSVYALAAYGNTVYASGTFSKVGGLDRDNAAAIRTDAAATVLDWNPIVSGGVYCLAANQNTVYIGGYITTVGGVIRHHLAALDPNQALLDWNPDADNSIDTLTVDNGVIYAGGKFANIGGTPAHFVAALGTDGTLQTWSPNPDGEVESIVVNGNTVYIGGKFTNVGGLGGISTNGIAAINSTNYGSVYAWLSNPDPGAEIKTLALVGNTLYAGGVFSVSGTDATGNAITANHLAAFDTTFTTNSVGLPATGALNTNWLPGINANLANNTPGSVNSLLAYGTTLYAGGNFSASYTPPNSTTPITQTILAAISTTDASLVQGVTPTITGGVVYALNQDSGMIYAGGNFSNFGTLGGVRGFAMFDPNTGAAQNLGPVINGMVYALAVNTNSIYAGGLILQTDSQYTYNLSIFPK